MTSLHHPDTATALGDLTTFRQAFYHCLTTRADALFELTDAALCTDAPITSLVELSLATEHRRGHGSLYDGLNSGRIDIAGLRNVLARQANPRCDGRIVLAIDVSHWLRPDAATSPERLFCHTYGRGKGQAQMIPGWPYSFVAALEPGRSSWTAMLDVIRMRPTDDHTDLAATQLRTVVTGLITAGQWHEGDPEIWIIGDSGYDGPRLALLLGRSSGPDPGAAALGPGLTLPAATTPARRPWPPYPTRCPVHLRRSDELADPGAGHDHRHHPLRHGACPILGSVAHQADSGRCVGRA
jgi:hypothetical protein